MGIFDSIKDALTVDDQERLDAANGQLTAARAELAKVQILADGGDAGAKARLEAAQKAVDVAQGHVDEFAAKVAAAAPAVVNEVVPEPQVQPTVDPEPVEVPVEAPVEAITEPVVEPVVEAPVEPAPVAPEPVAPQYREYTVKSGDSLSRIGKQFGVNWRDIASLNGISNPDRIFPGQVFKIPN